jgi:hypothetical protein
MKRGRYDPQTIAAEALLWRLETEGVTLEATRLLCLEEAVRCESEVQRSHSTPVLSHVSPVQWRGRHAAFSNSGFDIWESFALDS